MATGMQVWSATASANNTADSAVNWSEGQAPSTVNDSARAMMASAAKWISDNNGTLATTGSSSAFTVTSNQVESALTDGYTIALKFHATTDASATLAVDSLTAKPLQLTRGTNLSGGEFLAGSIHKFTYSSTGSGQWVKQGGQLVQTPQIAASAVTYAKIQNVTDQRLLGNFSGSAAAPSEYSISGPVASGSAITFPFPLPATYKNLVIKVASNTTVTVTADYVVTTNGSGSYLPLSSINSTINLGTTGANALDTGTVAIDTWYAIHVIGKADGTVACVASTSATSPTLPSGYTFSARVGWVRTVHGSATLYGTWQLGRKVQYVAGLAQTSTLPTIMSGTTGTYDTVSPTLSATSISTLVPTTASLIRVVAGSQGDSYIVAPSSVYSGTNNGPLGSNGLKPPIWNHASLICSYADILLESSSIYVAGNLATAKVHCFGWEDNI